jgi:DnaJ-domain-containing protein 1
MDQIFDRLGNLLKSFVGDGSNPFDDGENASFSDPDLQDAWEELDEFMRTGEETPRRAASGSTSRAAPKPAIPRELERDYRNLGATPGTPLPEVAKSYKQLLRKHHPDRHAADPAAFAAATEKTKGLTASFRRIRKFHETGKLD